MKVKFKAYFIIGFFSLAVNCASGQNQKLADSLVNVYKSGSYEGDRFAILKDIASNETNPERKLEFSELLIKNGNSDSLFNFLYAGYLHKGNALRVKGDLAQALEAFFESTRYANRIGDNLGIAKLTISIADTYSEIGNSRNAEIYYNKGILLLRQSNDSISLGTALLNAGDEYFNSKKYDSAILYFQEAAPIFTNINYLIGTAYTLGNLGMVYAEQGKDDQAEANINEAIRILEGLQDYYPISVYLTYMSDIYLRQNDFTTALSYALRSLALATRYRVKDQISETNLKISEIYDRIGNPTASYKYYKDHILYRDSVQNIESVQQMADLRTNYEVAQKQTEVDLLNQQRKNQRIVVIATAVALFLICLLAFGLYRRYRFINTTNKIIKEEQSRSEALLLNILPEETAIELKQKGKVQVKKFESVTVLFTDFIEFTKLAEAHQPEHLIKSVDFYFKEFDKITTKYGLEKIKTIGDSYMCAGGLPTESLTHAKKIIRAAKEMIDLINTSLLRDDDLIHFEIRIGVHTGPVVAGIVGNKKWQYDIWGDTVNIASRMESNSESGRVNLSEATYLEIKDEFPCTYRGNVDVKNRGSMKMYFLS